MPRPRVFISTDLLLSSEEKDDAQSLIHALMYQDKMNIVGIAASPSKWNHQDGRVADIDRIIDAYGQDQAALRANDPGFKTAAELRAVSWQGATDTAPSQGWSSPTDASRAIIAQAKAAAAAGEKLNVLTWGGETDLAQALHDDPSIARHIRFFNIDDQDLGAYAYIKDNFRDAFDMWVDNQSTFRGTSTSPGGAGGIKDIIRGWHGENAADHGALGDLFARVSGDIFNEAGVKMGDSPTVLRFLSGDQDDPTQESWGGEFVQAGPRYYTDNPDPALDFDRPGTQGARTVYEDRAAWMADFAERFDWLEDDDDDDDDDDEDGDDGDPVPPSGGNLLVNGSFEATDVAAGRWGAFRAVTGWTALEDGRIELWNAHRGVRAMDGDTFAELDHAGARDGFTQAVDAGTGQAYALSFDLRTRPGESAGTQGVEVVWNGRVVATATPGAQWGTFTANVTGAAGQDRLTIREVAGQGGDGLGALVDDFVLVAAGTAAPAAPDTVTVRVSGDAWQGDPAFALTVNGETVTARTVVGADRAEGERQTLTFTGDWDLDGSDSVGIRFLEDRYAGSGRDRNLYVDEVELNGEANGRDHAFRVAESATWDF